MAFFESDLDAKQVHALANGLIKRRFYGEDLTTNYLKEQIFAASKMSDQAIMNCINTLDKTLQQAAAENWLPTNLEKYLQTTNCAEVHVAALLKLWSGEHDKVHQTLVQKSSWNASLSNVAWRIDVKNNSKHAPEVNQPTAIMQMRIRQPQDQQAVVQFELDRREAMGVLSQISNIEACISKTSAA